MLSSEISAVLVGFQKCLPLAARLRRQLCRRGVCADLRKNDMLWKNHSLPLLR